MGFGLEGYLSCWWQEEKDFLLESIPVQEIQPVSTGPQNYSSDQQCLQHGTPAGWQNCNKMPHNLEVNGHNILETDLNNKMWQVYMTLGTGTLPRDALLIMK